MVSHHHRTEDTGKAPARPLSQEEIDDAGAAYRAALAPPRLSSAAYHQDNLPGQMNERNDPVLMQTLNPTHSGPFQLHDWDIAPGVSRAGTSDPRATDMNRFRRDLRSAFAALPKNKDCKDWATGLSNFAGDGPRKSERPLWWDKLEELLSVKDIKKRMEDWRNGGRQASIGHRTAGIYHLDRAAWIRAHNPRLASLSRPF
ncbi:hypothetical protein JCM10207_004180 [Rhodosporidiobolus poonsookiae]